MARGTLAVPASCCSVERMFSVYRRIATWQRSHVRDSTLSDLMMYKAAMNLKDAAPKFKATIIGHDRGRLATTIQDNGKKLSIGEVAIYN